MVSEHAAGTEKLEAAACKSNHSIWLRRWGCHRKKWGAMTCIYGSATVTENMSVWPKRLSSTAASTRTSPQAGP